MNGIGSHARSTVILGVLGLIAAACGTRAGTEQGSGETSTGSDGSSGSGSTTPIPGTSSSSEDSTLASTTSAESTTADESTTGSPEPVVTCTERGCQRSCSYENVVDLDDQICECSIGVYADTFADCELPVVCEDKGHYCLMQALRYGIAGTFEVSGFVEYKISGSSTIQILGDGRVRSLDYVSGHTCCAGASVEEARIENFPMTLRAVDDPFWQACLADIPKQSYYEFPECYQQVAYTLGECEGPLEACPDVVAHVPGCDAECPMAEDGVCDEPAGTGLCADGCDPLDCACPDDVAGDCDEVSDGGVCPLGSDGDDCPGIER